MCRYRTCDTWTISVWNYLLESIRMDFLDPEKIICEKRADQIVLVRTCEVLGSAEEPADSGGIRLDC